MNKGGRLGMGLFLKSEMINVKIKRGFYRKPKMVIGYNAGKNAIDLSDYMSAYKNPLRKTIKWYRKLAC
ncbi:hypothetical protein HZH68_014200 [Vespula germanica]|uniref:Uncharacterized protein n=1 Tax=Vespula germanica TaxID=30212 RepID=A0A834MVK8_VESGE|nr:hypothetical protein HZH68_014200 [Vespula germanica]